MPKKKLTNLGKLRRRGSSTEGNQSGPSRPITPTVQQETPTSSGNRDETSGSRRSTRLIASASTLGSTEASTSVRPPKRKPKRRVSTSGSTSAPSETTLTGGMQTESSKGTNVNEDSQVSQIVPLNLAGKSPLPPSDTVQISTGGIHLQPQPSTSRFEAVQYVTPDNVPSSSSVQLSMKRKKLPPVPLFQGGDERGEESDDSPSTSPQIKKKLLSLGECTSTDIRPVTPPRDQQECQTALSQLGGSSMPTDKIDAHSSQSVVRGPAQTKGESHSSPVPGPSHVLHPELQDKKRLAREKKG